MPRKLQKFSDKMEESRSCFGRQHEVNNQDGDLLDNFKTNHQ